MHTMKMVRQWRKNEHAEAHVAQLEFDVSYLRRDVDELKSDVKSHDKNMIIVRERLDSIKVLPGKKTSAEAVVKKISDARLLFWLAFQE